MVEGSTLAHIMKAEDKGCACKVPKCVVLVSAVQRGSAEATLPDPRAMKFIGGVT